jgi:aminodeoxychorismate synthase component I
MAARQHSAQLAGMGPLAVARALRHLPGLVFFDTAGHPPAGAAPLVSRVAALPQRILRGSIHHAEDRARLRAALHDGAAGGLAGWVDYEGGFVFGDYHQQLVFHHHDGSWRESGTLSRCLRENPADMAGCGPIRACGGRADFLAAVRRAREWIAAGDIYQVNLSQAFEAEVAGGSLFGLYEILRTASPAPMAAWLALDGREVLCSSPESFLRIDGRRIETRPIKGTRPRSADPDEDRRAAAELRGSPKENAELVMITDLLRNDLGQVCEFGSVRVTDMLRLESLAQVHHLVSTVTGTLQTCHDAIAALAACFPGGSITGAPKIRAMEIIRTLEGRPRGLYCGAIGWLGRDGHSSFNIAIRTLVREGGRLVWQTGAGIVADSDPQLEYEETLHKAAGIRLALERHAALSRI